MRSWRDWSWDDGNFWGSGLQPLDQLTEMYYQLNEAIAPVRLHDQKKSSESEVVLTSVELDELHEALQQKKISAVQIYRKLRPALRPSMAEEAYKGLDEAMAKLDFATARNWLAQLPTGPAADGSAGQNGEM